MKKRFLTLLLACCLIGSFTACDKGNNTEQPPQQPEIEQPETPENEEETEKGETPEQPQQPETPEDGEHDSGELPWL